MSAIAPFDLAAPLPEGRTAIGASAGTGKTYTLAVLAARFVAETDVPVDQLLVVTYTRAAAAELRDRVRSRLVTTAAFLADPSAATDEAWLQTLAAVDPDERAARAERVARAVADFDAATITTIHSFAQQVLASLGTSAPGDPDAELLEDAQRLVRQVCTDLLVDEALRHPETAGRLPTTKRFTRTVERILANPGIQRLPHPDVAQGDKPTAGAQRAARMRDLVDRAVDTVHRRRRESGTLAFDDLLAQLDAALDQPAVLEEVRRRFHVGLVDEFQDTDALQWSIFAKLFAGSDHRLVLVGDPKQAIYAFRGADVHTFLRAVDATDQRFTLAENWRSDGAVLDALDALLTGATFGDAGIAFDPVEPAEHHRDRRLTDHDGRPLIPLDLRVVAGDDFAVSTRDHAYYASPIARTIDQDVADHVRHLLDHAVVPAVGNDAARPLRPRDVAILIARHSEAPGIRAALARHGIPATVSKVGSVLKSTAAGQWRWLLEAIARPSDPDRARTAALSWFSDWTALDIATASDDRLAGLQERLAEWGSVLARRGTAEFCARVRTESGVVPRRLALPDGDREVTDLAHVAELLQVAVPGRTTASALLAALAALTADADRVSDDDLTARRIESEAEAVQIMTLFAAKGLEFPVVCVPNLWRGTLARAEDLVYRDEAGTLTIDVANHQDEDWPKRGGRKQRQSRAHREARGSNLRQLYVALTRARHHTAVWWSLGQYGAGNGLTRLLFARDEHGALDPARYDPDPDGPDPFAIDPDPGLAARAGALLGRDDRLAVTAVTHLGPARPDERWVDPERRTDAAAPEVATLDRRLERRNRRWSFSTMIERVRNEVAGLGSAGPAGPDADTAPVPDPEDVTDGDAGAADEPTEPRAPDASAAGVAAASAASDAAAPLPLASAPAGNDFGTFVHSVMESVDFASPTLADDLRADIDDRLRASSLSGIDPGRLTDGLVAVVDSPLGPLFGTDDTGNPLTLRAFPRTDRLDELAFDLRLAGDRGDPDRPLTDADLGAVVCRHVPDGPLREWAEACAAGRFGVPLVGHLTGSIDLVLRVRGHGGAPDRFVVCDYKTNRLTPTGVVPTSATFHPDRLPDEMTHAHYVLQMLLYAVAVHRYLRWRLPDYEPAVHLAGGAYLFVRGMAGPGTPVVDGHPHGVFSWAIPPALVVELSDLLAGERPAEAGR